MQLLVQHVLDAMTKRMRSDETGQGTLEYVGMVAVAAVLVVAVLTAAGTVDLGGFFTTQIQKVKDLAP
jgi:Flp pilus assembly pilin Flp